MAPGPSDSPALLEEAGILQTRFAQTVQNPFRPLLRCSAGANGDDGIISPRTRTDAAPLFPARKIPGMVDALRLSPLRFDVL